MKHEMKLKSSPFETINAGKKCVELRLYDEKRQKLNIGDTICFTQMDSGEQLQVEIVDLRKFPDFYELYKYFSPVELGYAEGEEAKAEDMYAYYPKEDVAKYGVLAICIRKI